MPNLKTVRIASFLPSNVRFCSAQSLSPTTGNLAQMMCFVVKLTLSLKTTFGKHLIFIPKMNTIASNQLVV